MKHTKSFSIAITSLALAATVGQLGRHASNPQDADDPDRPAAIAIGITAPVEPETQAGLQESTGSAQLHSERITLRKPEPLAPGSAAFLAQLAPRTPHPKTDPKLPNRGGDYRIVVKFVDEAKARPGGDGRLSLVADRFPPGLVEIADGSELEFEPYFAGIEENLTEIEARAARQSGNAQADLLGVTVVKPDDTSTTLELATRLNDLEIVEYAYVEALDAAAPPPADIAPATPDLTSHQAWRSADPGLGADHAWASNGKGQGVRVSVIEGAYRQAHEDLADANLLNGLVQQFGSSVPTAFSNNVDVVSEITGITPRDHGTSTLGVICAQENGYGMSGLAPEASVAFYSNDTVNSTFTTAFVLALAASDSDAGDIILLEAQSDFMFAENQFGPAELQSAVWDATKAATDAGIVVVAAAGNGGIDLDSPSAAFYMNRGDSGAILVGAGSANSTHNRLNFSTYGSRVNVQAWGASVATTGSGQYDVGNDPDQGYKGNYSGTSSASALVAGACACVQSIELAAHGGTLSPYSMRYVLRNNGNYQGDAATNGNIGRAVDLEKVIDERFSATPKYVVESFQWTEDFSGTTLPNALAGWRILEEPGGGLAHNVGGALRLESNSPFTQRLSTATLHLRLAGKEGVTLDFDHRNYQDSYSGAGIDQFSGTADADGVFISADGLTWYRVETPDLEANDSVLRSYRVSLDTAAEAFGIEFNNDFRVRFQTYTGGRYAAFGLWRGRSFDNVSVHIGESGVLQFGGASTLITMPEGATRTLAILRSGGSEGRVAVRVRTVPSGTAEASDLTPMDLETNLLDGENYKLITVTSAQDDEPEQTETFTVELYDPSRGARLGLLRTATVRILDDDTAGAPGVIHHGTNTTEASFPGDSQVATMVALPVVVPASGPAAFGSLRVRVNDLTHQNPTDLDIVLESPDGRRVMLMSDAVGRDFTIPDSGRLDHTNFEFARGATPVPALGPVTSGTFAPTDHPPSPDQFPAPIGTFAGVTDLGIFDGIDPRGTWTLYVQDQWSGGGGSLLGGWELLLLDGQVPEGLRPEITGFELSMGQAYLEFTTFPGQTYTFQSSTDLRDWRSEMGGVQGTGFPRTIHFPAATLPIYYRIVWEE